MKKPAKISAVILDMDGLMFDTERVSLEAWRRAMADFGYALVDTWYAEAIGLSVEKREEAFREILGLKFPFYEVRKLKESYLEKHISNYGVPMKPGLLELLEVADKLCLKEAVASSTEKELVRDMLERTALIDRFDTIIGGDEVREGKPAPDLFLLAARRLGIPAELCIVFEDSNAGVKAAHTAGMMFIMVPDLEPPSEEVASLAYGVCPSLHEASQLLVQLFEPPSNNVLELTA